jgi:hypothetical protein
LFTRARRESDRAIFIETVALIALTLLAIERNFDKGVFKYKGAIHPLARLSAPLTPFFVKDNENTYISK